MKIAWLENVGGAKIDDAVILLNSEEAGILIDILERHCKENKRQKKAKRILKALELLPYKPYFPERETKK